MQFVPTQFPGLFEVLPSVFEDSRGYFFESFNETAFEKAGISVRFVQDNQSKSSRNVLRGLHFQQGEFAQAKLVRVLSGEVLDVVVDLRKGSPTFGQHYSVRLSAKQKNMLFIPRGFAHGFLVTSDEAEFFYKCDNVYNKASEGGIRYNDPALNIQWGVKSADLIISDKDQLLPDFAQLVNSFVYTP